jgi:hypothetical protein
MRTEIVFGNRMIPVTLPDNVQVVPPGLDSGLKPATDLAATIAGALNEPLGLPPIRELVRPGSRVTIAFDDPTVPCFAPVWEPAIRQVIAELEKGGVRRAHITLLCANGLHRKFTRQELARILGDELAREFGYRLVCHDAEDAANLSYLGSTDSGCEVEINRLVTDSDLTVYVNTAVWRGFNGGWKSVCVGLGSWRSIRWHHTPESMSMSMEKNRMHAVLDEMGALVEDKLGKERLFKIETVLANPLQVHAVWAGRIGDTRREALELLKTRLSARREATVEKADVVIYGIPDWSPYAAFSSLNPILTLLSTGLGYLGGAIEAVGRPGCSVILASPCPDRWDHERHPAHKEIWEKILPRHRDPWEIADRYEEDFAHRPEYIYRYRYCHGFHPVHGLMATYPLRRLRHAGRVFVAGAEAPPVVAHLGFEPAATVEDALGRALEIHGRDAPIALVRYPMWACRT